MSECGGHWEWSLPGSLSFSVVLLRPTPSPRDGSAILRGHTSHEGYTDSTVEGREINLHRPIPWAPGIEPGAAAWQAHTLPLALLQPFNPSNMPWPPGQVTPPPPTPRAHCQQNTLPPLDKKVCAPPPAPPQDNFWNSPNLANDMQRPKVILSALSDVESAIDAMESVL